MPACCQSAGFGLSVADHAKGQQVRRVEYRAVGVQQGVAQLAALVDAARRVRRRVAGDAAGEAELLEQAMHPGAVPGDAGEVLGVGAFQPGVGHDSRAAVPRPGDEQRIQVPLAYGPVHVGVNEVQPRRGAPVAQQPRLDVLDRQRLPQQRGWPLGRPGPPTGSLRPANRHLCLPTPRDRAPWDAQPLGQAWGASCRWATLSRSAPPLPSLLCYGADAGRVILERSDQAARRVPRTRAAKRRSFSSRRRLSPAMTARCNADAAPGRAAFNRCMAFGAWHLGRDAMHCLDCRRSLAGMRGHAPLTDGRACASEPSPLPSVHRLLDMGACGTRGRCPHAPRTSGIEAESDDRWPERP